MVRVCVTNYPQIRWCGGSLLEAFPFGSQPSRSQPDWEPVEPGGKCESER